jgi:oxalate decarboxylase/phosphoglucose isomerase-like protein (cupin superfamily)
MMSALFRPWRDISIENTGAEHLVFLEMFKASRHLDVSLNQWIARMPDKVARPRHMTSASHGPDCVFRKEKPW